VGYASLFHECHELLLERHLLVMLAQIADLGGYLIELRRTHAEGPVSALPLKCEATFMHEPRGVCFEGVDRDANDIVAGNRKRRWLWFGIPPAARSGIFCSRAIDAINE
jgi:hypothetical protein